MNNLNDLLRKKDELPAAGECYGYLVFTDDIRLVSISEVNGEESADKLLEARIFNEKAEYRIKRSGLGKEWKERIVIDGDDLSESDYFDESYYLDINGESAVVDTTSSKTTFVPTAGRKQYTIPFAIKVKEVEGRKITDLKLKVRNYVRYYEGTGQAYTYDSRLCGFEEV